MYFEWLIPVIDYWCTLKPKELYYEIIIPLIAAITIAFLSSDNYALTAATKLRQTLPNILAILIGFSIAAITILVSGEEKNLGEIKNKLTNKRKPFSSNKLLSIYQWLLMLFCYNLIIQIILLIGILAIPFILTLFMNAFVVKAILTIQILLTLHILLLLIRNITNLYCVFFRNKENN